MFGEQQLLFRQKILPQIDGVDTPTNDDGQDWSAVVIVARYVEASLFSISPEHQLFYLTMEQ